jgi:transposase
MTARNCRLSWMAFVSHAPVDGDDLAPAQTDSLLTRATATHTVVACSVSGRSRTRFLSDGISGRVNVVERCINRLKQWRGLATRYEKRAVNYRAMVVLASIVLWLEA